MAYDIVKPQTPPAGPPPDEYWKYLASVSVSRETLAYCCVKPARVVGINSLQTITIEHNEIEYPDVPVWIHTDIGSRYSYYKKYATGESPELIAGEYFKNAALMFPFPGCVVKGDFGEKLEFNDEGDGVSFGTEHFDITTDYGRVFSADIVEVLSQDVATVKASYSVIELAGTPDEKVTVGGEVLAKEEYTINNEQVEIYITEISNDASVIPVECVLSLVNNKIRFCRDLLAIHMDPEGSFTTVQWAKLALRATPITIVHVVFHTLEDGSINPIGVIGIEGAGTSPGGPYPTYRMYAKMNLYIQDRQRELLVCKHYLYDIINDEFATIPYMSGTEPTPELPFFSVDGILNTSLSIDEFVYPMADEMKALYTETLEEETKKHDSLDRFLAAGTKLQEFNQLETASFGDMKYSGYPWPDTVNDGQYYDGYIDGDPFCRVTPLYDWGAYHWEMIPTVCDVGARHDYRITAAGYGGYWERYACSGDHLEMLDFPVYRTAYSPATEDVENIDYFELGVPSRVQYITSMPGDSFYVIMTNGWEFEFKTSLVSDSYYRLINPTTSLDSISDYIESFSRRITFIDGTVATTVDPGIDFAAHQTIYMDTETSASGILTYYHVEQKNILAFPFMVKGKNNIYNTTVFELGIISQEVTKEYDTEGAGGFVYEYTHGNLDFSYHGLSINHGNCLIQTSTAINSLKQRILDDFTWAYSTFDDGGGIIGPNTCGHISTEITFHLVPFDMREQLLHDQQLP